MPKFADVFLTISLFYRHGPTTTHKAQLQPPPRTTTTPSSATLMTSHAKLVAKRRHKTPTSQTMTKDQTSASFSILTSLTWATWRHSIVTKNATLFLFLVRLTENSFERLFSALHVKAGKRHICRCVVIIVPKQFIGDFVRKKEKFKTAEGGHLNHNTIALR